MKGVTMMDARLKILGGPASGQLIPISKNKLIVGREEDCHLHLTSEYVSRHHCVLLLDEYTLRIRDLGSRNGTFVNGKRIGSGETILASGDVVTVGDMIGRVDLGKPVAIDSPEVSEAPTTMSPRSLLGTGVIEVDTLHANSRRVEAPAVPQSHH
jgi:pSer/pThr/pTyr-binding forkhead associated (FHA) protein